MDHGDDRLQQDIHKTMVSGVVLILCISVPANLWINRHITGPKQNDDVAGPRFDLAPFYDAVSKCAPGPPLADSLHVIESFPFARMFYVVGSFLFLGLTLQLNVAQVSVLAWVLTVWCNFVFFLDRLVSAVAGAP